MRPGSENDFDDPSGGGATGSGPGDQALWSPLAIVAMSGGHMRRHSAMATFVGRTLVAGDPGPLLEEFHHVGTKEV
jgi:hypothetical protein